MKLFVHGIQSNGNQNYTKIMKYQSRNLHPVEARAGSRFECSSAVIVIDAAKLSRAYGSHWDHANIESNSTESGGYWLMC